MTSEINPTILIVDDDIDILNVLSVSVEHQGYDVLKAEDGAQGLALLEANIAKIQAIISDVAMPKLDGYEFCEHVRSNNATSKIPFIFVSALTSLEEKLKGYQVGGDEYISKPLEPEEVIVKVRNIIENKIEHGILSNKVKEANKVAMQAMTYSGNLGRVLQFMQESMNADSFEDLSKMVFEVTDSFGLACVLQISTQDTFHNFGSSGTVTPLESNIVELTSTKGRFFDFGARTSINHDDFSLLIKNMPVSDQEKYGTLKDLLGNLCNAIEARIKVLLSNKINNKKNEIISSVQRSLDNIDKSLENIQQANLAAIEKMIHEMEMGMFSFGLTETQEEQIRHITHDCMKKIDQIFIDEAELGKEFIAIHDTLNSALK